MAAASAPLPTRRPAPGVPVRPSRHRLRERRLLAERDRVSARLGELHSIRAVLDHARALLDVGWIQHDWLSYRAAGARQLDGRPAPDVCVVGAIVHAGRAQCGVEEQVVQRTLDLVWHTLERGRVPYVQQTPPPAVRVAHVRDIARWNDDDRRTRTEVITLLDDTVQLAHAESRQLASSRSS